MDYNNNLFSHRGWMPERIRVRKRPSSIDVARLAEVSQATVSYVLSNRTDKVISEVTRSKVLAAAEALSYMPNRLADGILRGKALTIGVLMPDFSNSFNSKMLTGMESEFADAGYSILIAHNRNSAEKERQQVRMLLEHRVAGIVAVGDEATLSELPTWVEQALRMEVSVCVVDDSSLDGVVDTVVSDDIAGASLAVNHLIEQGHERIAFLGGGDQTSTSRDRRIGYEQALRANGIEVDPSLMLEHHYRSDVDPDISPLILGQNRATAVFGVSDGLVGQAMMRLESEGIYRRDILAYVGYGNLEFARYLWLTTIEQHPIELGRRAASRMIARISGKATSPQTDRLAPDLVIRRSSFPTKEF